MRLQHSERLYQLALLISGDTSAAGRMVEWAHRHPDTSSRDPEIQMIRALGQAPLGRMRRQPDIGAERLRYTALDRDQARALLDIIAALPALSRLAIGLYYLRGMSCDEIDVALAQLATTRSARQPQATASQLVLSSFRISAARALALVPRHIPEATLRQLDRAIDGQLSEAELTPIRQAVFENAEIRAARDSIHSIYDLLARAIPALFSVALPAQLSQRLLEYSEHQQRRAQRRQFSWARLWLALGVVALVAAIIFVPGWLARPRQAAIVPVPSATELIDSAINRFDRAPLTAGILHETYDTTLDEQLYQVERWYDYASPHRLRMSIRPKDAKGRLGQPLIEISSDGRSQVQYHYTATQQLAARSFDASVSEAQAQEAIAILRLGPSTTLFSRSADNLNDSTPQYLAQARAAGATYLGQSTTLGRPTFLLSYRSNQLPGQSAGDALTGTPWQVVLTIDVETYSLLNVTAAAESDTDSLTRTPIQAQGMEILAQIDDSTWTLPSNEQIAKRDGLPSVRVPEIPSEQLISLNDALQITTQPIIALQPLPEQPMRGLAVPTGSINGAQVLLLYESSEQTILLIPTRSGAFDQQALGGELAAGEFHYQLLNWGNTEDTRTAALAFQPTTPNQQLLVIVADEYATPAEREETLTKVVGSLTPVTQENLPVLQQYFTPPATAGGQ